MIRDRLRKTRVTRGGTRAKIDCAGGTRPQGLGVQDDVVDQGI